MGFPFTSTFFSKFQSSHAKGYLTLPPPTFLLFSCHTPLPELCDPHPNPYSHYHSITVTYRLMPSREPPHRNITRLSLGRYNKDGKGNSDRLADRHKCDCFKGTWVTQTASVFTQFTRTKVAHVFHHVTQQYRKYLAVIHVDTKWHLVCPRSIVSRQSTRTRQGHR